MKRSPKFWFINFILIPIISIVLFSCSDLAKKTGIKDVLDPGANLTRQDYEKLLPVPLAQQEKGRQSAADKKDSAKEPAIPEAADILTAPKQPEIGPDKLVSISVTEDVPLKDVLIELGRLADVDMEIDPGITGGIIMKATNRPFSEVIKHVVELGNLRYENKNGLLKIERDT